MTDRGSVTIWMLGLSVLLLLFGGLAIDFWRALALQRELAAVADSAAVAAASGVDEQVYRQTGQLVLDPDRAVGLATSSIRSQNVTLTVHNATVSPAGSSVTVTVSGELQLGLLGAFVDQSEPLLIRAEATAQPWAVP